MFTEAQPNRSTEVTTQAIVRWFFIGAFLNAKIGPPGQFSNGAAFQRISRTGLFVTLGSQPSSIKNSGLSAKFLINGLLDGLAVFRIVTKDLLCITTGNIEEAIVPECHSRGAIKAAGFWPDKNARKALLKVVSQN